MKNDIKADEQIDAMPGAAEEAEEIISAPAGHEPRICHPAMDEEDAQKDEYARGYREAAEIGILHIQSVLCALASFKGNGHFAIKCAKAAHGMWGSLLERDQVEIADHFGCERANVNKLVKLIQKRLGLPPTLGQRSADGCQNMSDTRKSQLQREGASRAGNSSQQ